MKVGLVVVVAVLIDPVATATADGFYYSQSYGVSSARGEGDSMLGESLQLRIALGWRWGAFSAGPVLAGNLALDRQDATFGLIGGDPAPGDSDLEVYGADAKYNAALGRGFSIYVRGGPRYGSGVGALDGHRGFGVGAATGVQLRGKVRALGFLFAPLFFAKKGPLITASVFLDQNVDWFHMNADAMPTKSLALVGTNIGIGAGSYF